VTALESTLETHDPSRAGTGARLDWAGRYSNQTSARPCEIFIIAVAMLYVAGLDPSTLPEPDSLRFLLFISLSCAYRIGTIA